MKKLFSVILLVCMIPVFASASDLKDLSFDELLALQKSVVAEIMSRPEWKEVTVPGGSWTVGVDIPEGAYCISAGGKGGYVKIQRPGEIFSIVSQGIRNETNKIGKIDLKAGDVVTVDSGSVVFSPAVGLGF